MKIPTKRGERKRGLPPTSPPVDKEEREAGEVAGREREKERERASGAKWRKKKTKRKKRRGCCV